MKTILRLFILLLFPLSTIFSGCTKDNDSGLTCPNSYLSIAQQVIHLKFVDKQTGENLVLKNGLQKEDIQIRDVQGDKVINTWIMGRSMLDGTYDGSIEIRPLPQQAGKFTYQIKLGELATTTLNFSMVFQKKSDPCGFDYYKPTEVSVSGHAYEYLKIGEELKKDFLIVKI